MKKKLKKNKKKINRFKLNKMSNLTFQIKKYLILFYDIIDEI